MIVLSMVLVVVGFVLLMLGVLGVGDSPLDFVYYSIGACLLAAVFLIIGVVRGRPSKKPIAASGGEGKDASWSGASAWGDGEGEGTGQALSRDEDTSSEGSPRVQVVAAQEVTGDDSQREAPEQTWAPDGEDAAQSADDGADDDMVVVPKASAATRTSEGGVEVVAADDVTDTAPAGRTSAKKATAKKARARKATAKKVTAKKATAKKVSAKKATAAKTTAKKATAAKSTAKKATAKKATAKRTAPRASEAQRFEDALSNVSGVGPAKRKDLADHFGSYAKLKSASVQDLVAVDGISETLATRIRNTLNARSD